MEEVNVPIKYENTDAAQALSEIRETMNEEIEHLLWTYAKPKVYPVHESPPLSEQKTTETARVASTLEQPYFVHACAQPQVLAAPARQDDTTPRC